jgi:2-phospho-L-lactate guanylyltransferase (CobY/MobA/RfbA family)
MQFKLALFALLGVSFAQKELFLNHLEHVHHALDSLDGDVKALTASSNAAATQALLTSKSAAVQTALSEAIAAVLSSAPLDLIGASAIVSPADHLVKETEQIIGDLISKKDILANSKLTGTVLGQLKAQADSAQKLADAIASKVPDAAKSIARGQSGKIVAAIQKGISAFS